MLAILAFIAGILIAFAWEYLWRPPRWPPLRPRYRAKWAIKGNRGQSPASERWHRCTV